MCSDSRGNNVHRLCITKDELGLLQEHGRQPKRSRYITVALGVGEQMREAPQMLVPDKGYMRQIDVVECTTCLNSTLNRILRIGPDWNWYDGHTVEEKHWHLDRNNPHNTLGLRLSCFYSVYMYLLKQAKLAYQARGGIVRSALAKQGRIALVSVLMDDILSVKRESISWAGIQAEPDDGGGIVLKVSKLRIVDLMDQLPLIPSESFIDAVLNAPMEWHRNWHKLVDDLQPKSFHDFPAKILSTIRVK